MTVGNWIREALGPLLERAEREQAEAEEHARTCTDRPCTRCGRFVCPCGAPADGTKRCVACADAAELARLLAPSRESVPARYQWAYDGGGELGGRVRANAALVARAIQMPPSETLLVIGDTGSGKTSLAVAMLGAWVRIDPAGRRGARFAEAWRLTTARARFALGEGEAPEVAQAIAAPLLVLDDLGAERDDRHGVLGDVIFARHADDRPTWVTTWLEPAALAEKYGAGVARRLLEGRKVLRLAGSPPR